MDQRDDCANLIWPPRQEEEFIRSEEFGELLLSEAEALQKKGDRADFSGGVAQLFVWFDDKIEQDQAYLARAFKSLDSLRAYIRKSLKNYALQELRKEKRAAHLREASSSRSRDFEGIAESDSVRSAVRALPYDQQRIIKQVLAEGETITEAAQVMGIHRKQASRLYHKALDAIRERLVDSGPTKR